MHTCHLPYTKVFLHDVHAVALAANGHIQVLDSLTGTLLHSTATSTELTEKVQKSGTIVGASVDENFKYLVTATSDKTVRAWEVAGLRVVSEREAPKKPTDVCFTRDAQTILISDKFGDVHSYPLLVSDKKEVEEETSISGNPKSKRTAKRTADGSLLLGHVSLLTTLLLSKDEKYIITADRDEHIRVSWYPEAYTIERYCLGHKKFVSALHIPSWDPSLLISGGGDPQLNIWNWMDGIPLHGIPIADAVMPFVKVIRKKGGRGEDGSDGEGEEGAARSSSRAKRKNKKKGKGKGKGKGEPDADSDAAEGDAKENNLDNMQVDGQHATEAKLDDPVDGSDPDPVSREQPSQGSPLLAIQKIVTLESGSNRFIVFSVHGATALFYCKFPDVSGSPPQIRSVALDQPILDFSQWPGAEELWITVDGNWSETVSSSKSDSKFIRIVKVAGDELIMSDDSTHQSLAASLNTTSRLEASQDSLNDIDLYSALVVLPKNLEAEHSAMDDEALLSEAKGDQLSGKELGRLKSKKAVLARQAALSNKREQSDTPDEDRHLKRQKSESEANVE